MAHTRLGIYLGTGLWLVGGLWGDEPEKKLKTPTERMLDARKANEHGQKADTKPADKKHAEAPVKDPSAKQTPAKELPPKPAEDAEPAAAKPHPKAYPKPRKSLVDPKSEALRLHEAEQRLMRMAAENARLQETVAKREVGRMQDISVDSPDAALRELKEGNQRFVEGHRLRTLLSYQDLELRERLSRGQKPFAVIITCSDSRVVDSLIFDQELGRLFTIREAGNSLDLQGLASVEYAVEHLGSKLVVVLGHTDCGAVKAVASSGDKPLPGNLWSLQAAMAGLGESTPEDPNEIFSERLRRMERNHAKRQAQFLLDRSEIVRHAASKGHVKILAALYDLGTGRVQFLEPSSKAPAKEDAHHH